MNICMVLVDSLRADHLGCYGYGKETSPEIDRIARGSVLFEDAISQSNWTLPSIYSLITGRYQSALRISWWDERISGNFSVLPEFLFGNGYHTALHTPFKALLNPKSFRSHFQEARELRIRDGIPSIVKGWLKQYTRSFLFLHIGEFVHEPFHADLDLVKKYLDGGFDAGRIASSHTVHALTSKESTFKSIREIIARINTRRLRLSKDQVNYLLAAYDAGIHCVDDVVGQLHGVLKESGKDYLFILTADHGQAFLEHKLFGHGLSLYEELIRVPLIMDINGRFSMRISQPVQLADLYPTLTEVLGFPAKNNLDGVSLAPLLEGKDVADRGCLSEAFPFITIRKDGYKLITQHSRLANVDEIFNPVKNSWKKQLLARMISFVPDKLFDLRDDPGEKNNLRRREREIHGRLMAELNTIAKGFNRESYDTDVVGIDEDIMRQLKQLGYL